MTLARCPVRALFRSPVDVWHFLVDFSPPSEAAEVASDELAFQGDGELEANSGFDHPGLRKLAFFGDLPQYPSSVVSS